MKPFLDFTELDAILRDFHAAMAKFRANFDEQLAPLKKYRLPDFAAIMRMPK